MLVYRRTMTNNQCQHPAKRTQSSYNLPIGLTQNTVESKRERESLDEQGKHQRADAMRLEDDYLRHALIVYELHPMNKEAHGFRTVQVL